MSVGMVGEGKTDAVHGVKGIIPIGTSKILNMELVGHGEKKHDCGHILTYGCLHWEEHPNGLAEIHRIAVSCKRPQCPVCYEKWAAREALRVAHRFKQITTKKIAHYSLRPPKKLNLYTIKDLKTLKKLAIEALARRGIHGGSFVYHPKSRKCDHCGTSILPKHNVCHVCCSRWHWEFSPHFHLLTTDWSQNIAENYKKDGWFVRNHKIRRSLIGTVSYELDHAGYLGDKKHHLTWFGTLSYNKKKTSPLPKEALTCSHCKRKLKKLYYFGQKPLPDEEGIYHMNVDDFKYKNGEQVAAQPAELEQYLADRPPTRKEIDAYAEYEKAFKQWEDKF